MYCHRGQDVGGRDSAFRRPGHDDDGEKACDTSEQASFNRTAAASEPAIDALTRRIELDDRESQRLTSFAC